MATLTVSADNEKRVKAMGFLSNKGTDNFSGRIITVNGKVSAEQMECIAQAANTLRKRRSDIYYPSDRWKSRAFPMRRLKNFSST